MKNHLPAALLGSAFSFFFATSLFAQQGTQTIFVDDSENQLPTTITFVPGASMSDHNLIISGYSGNTNNTRDVILLRTDITGALIHSDQWGSNRRDVPNSAVLNGTTILFAGITNDPSVGTTNRAITWEYDLLSNTLVNTNAYHNNNACNFRDIILDGGDYIGCGPVMTGVPSGREFGLARIDFAGNVVNSGATGTAATNTWLLSPISVCTNPVFPGDYFQVGYRQTQDAWFASTDNAFNPLNLVQYTNGNGCRMSLKGILPIPGANEFWTYGFMQNCQSNISGRDIVLMRIDQMGMILQQHVIGSNLTDDPRAMRLAMNGNLIISGTTNSFSANGDNDIFVMEVNTGNGNVIWLKLFGSSNNDRMLGVDATMELFFDSNFGLEYAALVGQQQDDLGDWDAILITTPLAPVPDERCVDFNTMTTVASSIVATQHNPQGAAWANLVPANHPNMLWKPVEADLCPSFKLSTTQDQATEDHRVFNTYPNPVSDVLTVELPETSSSSFELRITDAMGRLVHFELVSPDRGIAYLDLSQFTTGMYLLELSDGMATTYREKLMKD